MSDRVSAASEKLSTIVDTMPPISAFDAQSLSLLLVIAVGLAICLFGRHKLAESQHHALTLEKSEDWKKQH